MLLLLLGKGVLAREQVDAAVEIKDAWAYRTGDVRLRVSDLDRPRQGYVSLPAGRHEAWLNRRFVLWAQAMKAEALSIGAVVEVCVDNRSLSACDRLYGRRHGWARWQLDRGLALYCDLHGLWPRIRRAAGR